MTHPFSAIQVVAGKVHPPINDSRRGKNRTAFRENRGDFFLISDEKFPDFAANEPASIITIVPRF